MSIEKFRESVEVLIEQGKFNEAEELMRKNAKPIPESLQDQPFRSPVVYAGFTPSQENLAEAQVLAGIFTSLSRSLRKGRYLKMLDKKPDRLRVLEEGDSWHQYPVLLQDMIDHLSQDYAILSLSAPGDTIREMVLHGEYSKAIKDENPDVFMFSAGGNDILGQGRLEKLLLAYKDGATPDELVNKAALAGSLKVLMDDYRTVVTKVLGLKPGLQVFLHGYDNVLPRLRGRWLGKPLEKRGIPIKLGAEIVEIILGEFNLALAEMVRGMGQNVRHFDLRGQVGSSRKNWQDELHPSSAGFGRCAAPIWTALSDLERNRAELRQPGAPELFAAVPEALGVTLNSQLAAVGNMSGQRTLFGQLLGHTSSGYHPPKNDQKQAAWVDTEMLEAQHELDQLVAEFGHPETDERVNTRLEYSMRAVRHAFEAIIGDNNFDEYYVLSKGVAAGLAVARLHVRGPGGGAAYGTGFLIGGGLLMTNNHVLPAPDNAAFSFASFNYEYLDNGAPNTPVDFRLKGDVFLTSKEFDYSIISVEQISTGGKALVDFGNIELLPRSGKALKKEFVNILQHPGGDYKKVALRENLVVGRARQFLYYATDTQPGSSGSPVFNEEWQLAALHHMAIRDPENPDQFRANRGIRISAILDDISKRCQSMNSDAQHAQKILMAIQKGQKEKWTVSPNPHQLSVPAEHPSADGNGSDEDWAEETDQTGKMAVPGQLEANRPELPISAAQWPSSPRNAPDTWHLPAEQADTEFVLDPELLEDIVKTGHFSPHKGPDGNIIVALRGCRIADGSPYAEMQKQIRLKPVAVNHEETRCLICVWHDGSDRISVFEGSTVPRRTGMKRYYDRVNFGRPGSMCNMLPTGCYEYCVGTHFSASKGPVEYVLRLGNGPNPSDSSKVTVLRSSNDLIYGTQDIWDSTRPADNIHPGFLSTSFSSLGCLTLPGTQSGGGKSYKTGSGVWRRFRQLAGFDGQNMGDRYDLLLITGHEAAAIAHQRENGSLVELTCLRHGSGGEVVKRLQDALSLNSNGNFGPDAKFQLSKIQFEQLGFATGTYSPEMAGLLGFEF